MSITGRFVSLVSVTLQLMLQRIFPKPHVKFLHQKLFFQTIMKWEIQSAVNLITHLVRLKVPNIREYKLYKFRAKLIERLAHRYSTHWYPEKPQKGTGYRTIRKNDKIDPIITFAGKSAGFTEEYLIEILPEFTIWIDPFEVIYRFGENGPLCVLYDYTHPGPWKHTNKIYPAKSKPPFNLRTYFFQKINNFKHCMLQFICPKNKKQ